MVRVLSGADVYLLATHERTATVDSHLRQCALRETLYSHDMILGNLDVVLEDLWRVGVRAMQRGVEVAWLELEL